MPAPFASGRARVSERKRAEGAEEEGVMVKRLDAKTAPSGWLPVTGGMSPAITEFWGSARPRMPMKSLESGSSSTSVAAAG